MWFIGVAFDPGLWKTPRSLLSGFYKASYMPLALRLMSPLQYCSMYAGGHSVLLVLCRAVPQQPAREALRAEIIRPLADLGWTFRAIMMRYRCLRAQKDGAWCVRTNEGGRRQSARAPPGVWYVATGRLPPLVPPSRERTGGGLTSSYNAMADGLGLLSVPSLSRSGRRKATRSGILLFSLSGIPSSPSLRRSPAICCFHDVHV